MALCDDCVLSGYGQLWRFLVTSTVPSLWTEEWTDEGEPMSYEPRQLGGIVCLGREGDEDDQGEV